MNNLPRRALCALARALSRALWRARATRALADRLAYAAWLADRGDPPTYR